LFKREAAVAFAIKVNMQTLGVRVDDRILLFAVRDVLVTVSLRVHWSASGALNRTIFWSA
jgi:hypothetical protein